MGQIRKRDLLRVLMRSFYIQSTWNSERLLGLGFCFCLIPVARRLFNNKEELIDFLQRHLDFFNSHPYMATFAMGAVANIEEQAHIKKWEDKRPITIFKSRVIGPLGALGDTLFWQLVRPILGIVGIVLLSLIGAWGSIVYLVAYNFFHLIIRIKGLLDGYVKGFDIVRDLSMRRTQRYFRNIKYAFASVLGLGLAVIMHNLVYVPASWRGMLVFSISLFVSFLLVRRQKIDIDLLIVIVVCSSIILGLVI
jgi:mannose/fructose/N-acetylgalactosamine-specific phosphotransferase system component IID